MPDCRFLVVLIVALAGSSQGFAQEYSTSIVGTDFDLITDDDPTCFQSLTFDRLEKRAEMPDKTRKGLFRPAYQFLSTYSDGTRVHVFVDARFGSETAARTEAMRYVGRLGKLPTVLRGGVERLVVHQSTEKTTAFSDRGLIVVYSANATQRILDKDLEETLFHESVHAAWDIRHAQSDAWKRAQRADGTFATAYAKRQPAREDLAESALFAFAVIHHPHRLPSRDLSRIKRLIPNRILFVETLIPAGRPLIYKADPMEFCDVDLSRTGTARDVIANVLSQHYQLSDRQIADCLENLGEELILAAARRLKINEKEFRNNVEEMKHVNCDHAKTSTGRK